MARYAAQILDARNAHRAVSAAEAVTRAQMEQALDAWDKGLLDDRTVRYRLEKIVRDAYRSSVALAVAHTQKQTQDLIPGWKPQERVFRTPYLNSLIADVQRNLREYKAAGKTDDARRRASLRFRHSAGVATQRGYTDALVSAYGEMQDLGLRVRKVWVANFDNHVPCAHCAGLNGTEVGLDTEYPDHGFPVYQDLVGPPAHPHCQCYLAILVTTLDNVFDSVDLTPDHADTAESTSMSSEKVRGLSSVLFGALVAFLTKAVKFLKSGR